jgi:hypothetical protein
MNVWGEKQSALWKSQRTPNTIAAYAPVEFPIVTILRPGKCSSFVDQNRERDLVGRFSQTGNGPGIPGLPRVANEHRAHPQMVERIEKFERRRAEALHKAAESEHGRAAGLTAVGVNEAHVFRDVDFEHRPHFRRSSEALVKRELDFANRATRAVAAAARRPEPERPFAVRSSPAALRSRLAPAQRRNRGEGALLRRAEDTI